MNILVADDLGFYRLERIDSDLVVDTYGFIRFDAKAGTKNCTPGRTVPCGNVCRQPRNCAKGKGIAERKARIGEDHLKEFAEVRKTQLSRSSPVKAKSEKERVQRSPQSVKQPPKSQHSQPTLTTSRGIGEGDLQQLADQHQLARQLLRKDSRYADNESVCALINEEAKTTPGRFRAVKDSDGNIQASAIVRIDKKLRGSQMYVSLLATAPWNIDGNDPRSVKGAGTKAMEMIVSEAVSRNMPVTLSALKGAIPFYQKIGFTLDDEYELDDAGMTLSVDAGKEFLKRRGVKMDNTDQDYESELYELEQQANGAFAKGKRSPKKP